ncbi:MAG: hypothetical protein ACRDS0_42410, partial [Pseudonocardiaceae bacterium]
MAGDIRNSKRFRELAALLRERAGREGVKLVGGEAEDLLAGRPTAIATQLGVTPRTALGYVSEDNLELLAQQLGSLAGEVQHVLQRAVGRVAGPACSNSNGVQPENPGDTPIFPGYNRR